MKNLKRILVTMVIAALVMNFFSISAYAAGATLKVTGVTPGQRDVLVNWEYSPGNEGAAIDYTIEITLESDGSLVASKTVAALGDIQQDMVDGLMPDTDYVANVYATNSSNGEGSDQNNRHKEFTTLPRDEYDVTLINASGSPTEDVPEFMLGEWTHTYLANPPAPDEIPTALPTWQLSGDGTGYPDGGEFVLTSLSGPVTLTASYPKESSLIVLLMLIEF
jgi:hypothetical protein